MGDKLNKSSKKQTFLQGALILMIATGLVKIIGALYKIPLGNIIGETGMGYYQTAYDLYLPIYSLAMAGLPVAVSRMVAESIGLRRYKDARRILTISKKAFLFTGIIGFFLMLVVSYPFVILTEQKLRALPAIVSIAPSILFCCIMSSYRGYYEGLRNMRPTAISQVIEAFAKLVFGLIAALVVKHLGYSYEIQAAAAIISISLGSFAGAFYLIIFNKKTSDGITDIQLLESDDTTPNRILLNKLVKIAIPVALGSLVVNIASLVDVTTVQSRLSSVVAENPQFIADMYPNMMASLLESNDGNLTAAISEIPTFLYGCYKGYAFSVYNLVPTITSVLGVSALPAITNMWSSNDKSGLKVNSESAVRVASLISMPCGLGMVALSTPIMMLLYPGKPGAVISGPLLLVLGFCAVFAGIAMPLTNMLQAIGKQNIPLYNIFVGALLKIVVNFTLVGIPEINIKGAPIGTAVCYFYICVMNLIFFIKYSKVRINFYKTLLKPLIAAVFCGASAYIVFELISSSLSTMISAVLSVGCAVVVYVLSVLLLKVLTKDDVLMLPKGEKILKVLEKIKMIG